MYLGLCSLTEKKKEANDAGSSVALGKHFKSY